MSFPWVSRALYDYALRDVASWKESADAWEERFDTERERADDLNARMLAMKQSGFAVPEPKPEPQQPKEPDVVTSAIIARSGKSAALRKHYYEFVNEQRGLGVDDEAIAAAIRVGETDDEGIPG